MKRSGKEIIKILHIEDLATDAELVKRELLKSSIVFEIEVVDTPAKFQKSLMEYRPDIILSDHSLPSFSSLQALGILRENDFHLPFILITSTMSDELAIDIMKAGANDYILKDRLTRLPEAILNLLEKFRLEDERRSYVDKLAENEKRFRAILEKGNDMILLTSIDAKIVYASNSITKFFGYSLAEVYDLFSFSFIHPDDLNEYIEKRKELLFHPSGTFYHQLRLKHKNGTWIWCEFNVTNKLDDAGINAIVLNFRDISERKKMELERQYDQDNLSALINNTHDLMWSIDREFKLITSNVPFDNMARSFFGKCIEKGEDVLSASYTPLMKVHFKQLYERAFSGESFVEIEHFEVPFEFWSEVSYYPIRHNGVVMGTACHSRDITLQVRSEQKIRESESFIRGVLNSLKSHIAVVNENGVIEAVNDSWTRFALDNGDKRLAGTGIGINYFNVCENAQGEDKVIARRALKGIKDVLRGAVKDFYLEYPCHSPTDMRWFGMRVVSFDRKVVVSHQDISERVIAENEILKKKEQLRELSNHLQKIREEERKNVAREIHDELGQQLTALKLDIDWIRHKQNNPDSKVKAKLEEMLKMNDGIINTVRRISSDLRPPILDDLGLIATIEWKCFDFEEKMNIPCTFICDVRERHFSKEFSINVYRILQESLTNISRHAQATRVIVSFSENAEFLTLRIDDDGIGIDTQTLLQTNRLGVLGMNERARMLGGTLSVEPGEGKGTVITLILPVTDNFGK